MANKADLSLPGAILIVVSQLFTGYQSSKDISGEIKKFRQEFQQSIVDRDTFFVRKTELAAILSKIDQMNRKMGKVSDEVHSLKFDLYTRTDEDEQNFMKAVASKSKRKRF